MKSDLLCQEASASSPAAPSGETGKTAHGKARSWGSCHPWPCTGAPWGTLELLGTEAPWRAREQLPWGSAGLCGAAQPGRGAEPPHAVRTSPGCIFRQKTWRNFFFSSFASKLWLSSEPSGTLQAPCPAPAPARVLLDPHQQLPCRACGEQRPDKQQTICAGDNNRCHLG